MSNGMGRNVGQVLFDSTSKQMKDEDDIYLEALPILLNGYEPSPAGLAIFLLRLAMEVNWNDKEPCFCGICCELGHYYSVVRGTRQDCPARVVSGHLFCVCFCRHLKWNVKTHSAPKSI
jgi:hypothetical protein